MPAITSAERRKIEALDAAALEAHQLRRLNQLLDKILPGNRFYARKVADLPRPLTSLDQLAKIPYTYKEELFYANPDGDEPESLTFPLDEYVRFHQTSGTRGRPMPVFDTAEDWQWWIETWQYILDGAGVTPADRALLAFSFGPFIGFWAAYDAAAARGCLVLPSGGMLTLARLEMIRSHRATLLFCTPSYALHMAEVGHAHQIDVRNLSVEKIIVAGEPGGSIPAVRARIEDAWGATVFDHAGASELGPWGYPDEKRSGLHIIESEFVAEFLSIETGAAAAEGELAELVITNLGRTGMPAIRYRTGDLVRPCWSHDGPNRFVLLEGGILGRRDDMLVVRGVNIYPGAIEQIVRSFPEVLEYRLTAYKSGEMDQLLVEVEDRLEQPERVSQELRLRLGLRVDVNCVPAGSLPRYEGKGKRFIDQRR